MTPGGAGPGDDMPQDLRITRRALAQGAFGLLVVSACKKKRPAAVSSSSPSEAGTSTSPRPTPAALSLAVEHGSRQRPEVALTFHGEGDPALLQRMLAVLAKHGTHCTIFAVGAWLQAYPFVARSVLRHGHELGNHTWTGASSLTMPRAQLRAEIERCRDLLVRQTGRPGVAFRPAQMQHANAMVLEEAERAGYHYVVTEDVDPGDSQSATSAAIVAHLTRWTIAGSIISLQIDNTSTLEAMPDVLMGLREARLNPVTVGRLLRT